MELNDQSEGGAQSAESETPAETREPAAQPAKAKPKDESEIEAEIESEIEADVASYESELEGEVAESKTRAEEESVASEYPGPWVPTSSREEKSQSLFRRLSPYLTVAGLLLIARIVVFSLRRRRR
ncbi:MAG: hypothetical protein ABSG36_13160 [Acidimicrobiales bacterium]|jgi:hypothetical protein